MLAYVRFERYSNDDREHADENHASEPNPRTRLRLQFEAELRQGMGEEIEYRMLDARYHEGEHTLGSYNTDSQEYIVEIEFRGTNSMIEACKLIREGDSLLQKFVLVLQNCYDDYGMAGHWHLLGASYGGAKFTLEQIQEAVALYDERTNSAGRDPSLPPHVEVYYESYTAPVTSTS